MIRTQQLTRRYGDVMAVDSVSFAIESGEIVGLLGHNGAGKTTIMKIMTGYLEPSSGSVQVDGVDVTDEPLKVQGRIGYLPENVPLYPEMTIVDYLEYAAVMRGVVEAERAPAVRRAIRSTNLVDRALDVIGSLSRGYRQRVGVAQAILHAPQFLILDEPTTGLDPSQTQQMRDLIKQLAETATVILSTHIMQEVDAVCDRVMILRHGQLVLDERLAALQQAQRLILNTGAGHEAIRTALEGAATVISDTSDTSDTSASDGAFYLTVEGPVSPEVIAGIAKRLVAGGVPIHALYPEKRDLESVFREVSEEQAGGEDTHAG